MDAVRFAGPDVARRVRARPILVPERWCGVGRRGTTASRRAPKTWDPAVVGVESSGLKWRDVETPGFDAATVGATSIIITIITIILTRLAGLEPAPLGGQCVAKLTC